MSGTLKTWLILIIGKYYLRLVKRIAHESLVTVQPIWYVRACINPTNMGAQYSRACLINGIVKQPSWSWLHKKDCLQQDLALTVKFTQKNEPRGEIAPEGIGLQYFAKSHPSIKLMSSHESSIKWMGAHAKQLWIDSQMVKALFWKAFWLDSNHQIYLQLSHRLGMSSAEKTTGLPNS